MKSSIDGTLIFQRLTTICETYEKSAPTVHAWADELYVRIDEHPEKVVLPELAMIDRFFLEDGTLILPNLAANEVYHLMHRLGMNTTGHAGY